MKTKSSIRKDESGTAGFIFILFSFGDYFCLVAHWRLLLLSNRLRKHDAARRGGGGGVVSMAAEDAAEVILLLTGGGDKINNTLFFLTLLSLSVKNDALCCIR